MFNIMPEGSHFISLLIKSLTLFFTEKNDRSSFPSTNELKSWVASRSPDGSVIVTVVSLSVLIILMVNATPHVIFHKYVYVRVNFGRVKKRKKKSRKKRRRARIGC